MSFLAPMAFWFAAAIPVVILFYLLKRKRVVRLVASTVLWQKFLAETQASAPFQKLRHNWLLLLQILLLLLVILALARPYFAAQSTGGRLLVVLLDASASMQSTDEKPSRFEKARAEALRLVDAMRNTDQMVVLQAGPSTEVRQSPTSEKAALRRAIQSSTVTDAAARLNEALKLAETLIQNNPKAEIHLLSDGAAPSLTEFENKNLPLVYHRLGQRSHNLGIVNLDVRAHPENPARRAIFISVANFSTNRQNTELELRFDGQLLEVKPLTLGPRETQPQVFVGAQEKDGIFSVRLTAQDDLAADNEAAKVSLLPQPVKVLLVTAGNRFLEKAIRAAAQVDLSIAAGLDQTAAAYDVVVLDHVAPLVWPAGHVLAFHAAATNWFREWMQVETPAIVSWKTGHPLLRFVHFDNVQIGESRAVKCPPWAVSLLEAPQLSLMVAGELGRQRVVWVGFDLLQSTWPWRFTFPIFIANAIDWLNPAAVQAAQFNVPAGTPWRFSLPEDVSSATITLASGEVRTRTVDAVRHELVFGDTTIKGIYRVRAGTNDLAFCVNLTDAMESD
ncbi:MAG: VWA domain-containing protein, partial [Chloroflexi bacterium]|nr:VWA domain-containing protein [Chloroflexota bacterium]